jgi:hypothetical protein
MGPSSSSKSKAPAGTGIGTVTEIEHVEAVAVGDGDEKPKKRQRLKRHLARFWCCYLLAGIIFLAIFLPVLYASPFSLLLSLFGMCCG